MSSVNKIMLIGNLGKNPELRYTKGGQAVCDLRLATDDEFTNRAGDHVKKTEWHTIVVWGKQAINCAQYLSKGRQIHVEGRLRTRSWTTKEGAPRVSIEVVADRVKFLGGSRQNIQAPPAQPELPPDNLGSDDVEF